MKTILSALLLMTLVACESGTSSYSHSKNCTYNGEPVDCEALVGGRPRNQSGEDSSPLSLKVSITSGIEITPHQFTFIENRQDVAKEVRNGEELTCEVSVQNNTTFAYKIVGETLTLFYNGQQERYKRDSGFGKNLDGKWVLRSEDEMGVDISIMVFSGDSVKIMHECHFK